MQIETPERSQFFYARLAGFMYLFNYLTSVFGAMAPGLDFWFRRFRAEGRTRASRQNYFTGRL